MRVTRGLWLWLPVSIALAVGLLQPQAARSQTTLPTSDQLELLRNLSPDQRDAILQQLSGSGVGSLSGSSSSTSINRSDTDRNPQGTDQDTQRRNSRRTADADADDED